MNDLKKDFKKRAASLKEEVKNNRISEKKNRGNGKRYINEKICPFMSTLEADRACTQQCKFYRTNKKGFECPFSELSPISYSLNKIKEHFED